MGARSHPRIIGLCCAVSLLLASCAGGRTPGSTATASIQPATATPTESPSATPSPPFVVLLTDPASGFPGPELQSTLDTLTAGGLSPLRTMEVGAPKQLPPSSRMIITNLAASDAAPYQQSAPEALLVLVGAQPGSSQEGITRLLGGATLDSQIAFAAGYTSALLAEDYRVGLVLPEENQALATAFRNGYQYYCGLCRPLYPPYLDYPVVASTDQADPAALAASFVEQRVRVAFIASQPAPDSVVSELAARGIALLGRSNPPALPASGGWLATFRPAPEQALEEAWPLLVGGSGPESVPIPIAITDRDRDVFSDGKVALVETVLSDLEGGWIDIGEQAP